jgi:NAD(P)-dependent dehydrogenase (short-subunit alcohol dehydrogenase family)
LEKNINERQGVRKKSESNGSLSGLRVAVTGGTSGLGLALVREFLQRGADVAFVARTRGQVEMVARDEKGSHGIVGDVSKKEELYP